MSENCDCIVQGETEEELMKNAAEHAVKSIFVKINVDLVKLR